MSEKDFLSQFSNDNKKPDSFKEEELIKIEKPKKNIDPKLIIGGIIGLFLLLGIIYFLFLRPNITMKNFVGLNKSEVAAFVRQQEIESTGIIFKEEYNFEYDADIIVSQSVKEGEKISKKVKIDFVISLGADPNEKIELVDIKSLNKEELEKWIKDNKLQKTKITTAYSDTVKQNDVISYELKGEENDFTRGTTLNISVSKGQAPIGTITIEDLKNKTQSEVESWATNKKIKVIVSEQFSDTVQAGLIISQYPEGGKTLKEGESLSITVSKGKGIYVPDFSKMSDDQINSWESKNNVMVNDDGSRYANSDVTIISQNPKAGSMIAQGETISLVKNLGKYFYVEGTIGPIVGTNYSKFVDTLNNIRHKGIDAFASNWTTGNEVYSDSDRGTILSVICRGYSDNKTYDCNDRLPLDARFDVVISKGRTKALMIKEKNREMTVSELMDLFSTEKYTFKLHPDITAEMFNNYATIVYADGSKIEDSNISSDKKTINVFEDKEYMIILTSGKLEPGN